MSRSASGKASTAAARVAAGRSYRDAAESAGVSLSTLQRAEAGRCDLSTLYALATYYGVQPRDLIPPAPAG